jgi:DNA processing protein
LNSTAAADDLQAWFRLLEVPRLGRDAARRLLAAFGSPDAAMRAPPSALRQVVPAALAATIGQTPPEWAKRWAALEKWLAAGERRCVLNFADARFPQALLQTADPPLLLFIDGELRHLAADGIAVVGSRHPTAQGLDTAHAFAAELGREGLCVVSGLALGIDAAAHEGALSAGGATLAVLGSGPDQPYPSRHAELAARISRCGALVSEYAPGTPPLANNFPQRNRIIAGLSLGTLVVEAALRSGSLITARLAAEAGREVFAIPGSIHAPQSKGCHQLLKQGAKLVETAADILEEIEQIRSTAALQRALTSSHRPSLTMSSPGEAAASETHGAHASDVVLVALGHDPTSLDALVARTGWPTAELNARLLELELLQQVARLPGGLYQRRTHA